MSTLRRFVLSTVAVAVFGLAGGIATATHDMDFDALSGSFQIVLDGLESTPAGDAAIARADEAFQADYSKNSKGISKIANAVGKLDKAFSDDAAYQAGADSFLAVMSVVHIQDVQAALLATVDDIQRSPLGPATRYAQALSKKGVKLSAFLEKTNKSRKAKLKKIAGLQRLAENGIRRYG